ncbi:AMP-binding protein [Serratia ureilytica]
MYTSGSTGRLKGVVVNHRAIVNRLFWMQHDECARCAGRGIAENVPCSFDVSVWEFFWPLMVGARLVMAPPEAHRDPQALTTLIDDYGVTTRCISFRPWPWRGGGAERAGATAPRRRQPQTRSAAAKRCRVNWLPLSGVGYRAAAQPWVWLPTGGAVDVTYQPASGAALAACERRRRADRQNRLGKHPAEHSRRHAAAAPVGCAGDPYPRGIQLAGMAICIGRG